MVLHNYNRFINLGILESKLRMFAFVERLLNLLHLRITQNLSRHDIKTMYILSPALHIF